MARAVPGGVAAVVVTLFNWANRGDITNKNPFRRLGRRGKGRADKAPPTREEFEALLAACDALGDSPTRCAT